MKLIFIFVICLNFLTYCLTPYIEYVNSNNSEFVDNHYSLGFKYPFEYGSFVFGLEYLKISTFGSIHQPSNGYIITNQQQLAIPISFEKKWKFNTSIQLFTGIGYKLYFQESISSNSVNSIESKMAVNGQYIASNYSEEIDPHPFFKIGFSYIINRQFKLSFSKTWQTLKNNIRYTFLNNNQVSTTSELSYDPISISLQYNF